MMVDLPTPDGLRLLHSNWSDCHLEARNLPAQFHLIYQIQEDFHCHH